MRSRAPGVDAGASRAIGTKRGSIYRTDGRSRKPLVQAAGRSLRHAAMHEQERGAHMAVVSADGVRRRSSVEGRSVQRHHVIQRPIHAGCISVRGGPDDRRQEQHTLRSREHTKRPDELGLIIAQLERSHTGLPSEHDMGAVSRIPAACGAHRAEMQEQIRTYLYGGAPLQPCSPAHGVSFCNAPCASQAGLIELCVNG